VLFRKRSFPSLLPTMAPNCSAAVSSSSFNDDTHEMKPRQALATTDATVSAEADLKYKEEMKKFENKKVLLKLEMAQVACIVSEKYPDLAIARAVKSDPYWRYEDEERMRVRIGLKMMRRKAKDMTFDALCLEQDLLSDIDRRTRLTVAGIAALEINRKLQSRKRTADSSEEGKDESKRLRLE
ncbi:hypothetical protein PRIPAC_70561, partial [Pristionchus pacificus]|uniref:Uncharacterized protein n=1 Tax=Pristionchus pacificus TaxID=54126 RepID=A0A2A6C6C8_PRIPA